MSTRLPDFLIIGAMKSGTTTLYEHLERHPGVFMSTPKEPNYFSIDEVYQKGPDWYRGLFAEARADQICGEASPSYTRFPRFSHTAGRIAQSLPYVKLVYIMRHPVERFYSNYVFDRSYGFRDSIRETLRDRGYVLETSNYMLQIDKYLEHFPREQMLLLLLDDLQDNPQSVYQQLLDFLGLKDSEVLGQDPLQANPRGRNYMVRQCNTRLQQFRSLPGFQSLKRVVPAGMRSQVREYVTGQLPDSRLGKWLSRRQTAQVEPLTDQLRQELLARLAEPTARLEQYLGRDLTAWRT